jgi:DNA-binding NarL/FixJ family response regulator
VILFASTYQAEKARTSLWLVEDNQIFRETISHLLNTTEGFRCEKTFATVEAALSALADDPEPDVVLMDIGLPGMSGIEGVKHVRSISPSAQVIILTIHEENENVFEAICAGASGYLLKSSPPEKIIEGIHEVVQGGAPINAQIARKVLDMFSSLSSPKGEYGVTKREKDILRLLIDGLSKKQIADQIFLSYHTIDTHLKNIYTKLHVHTRSGAVAKVLKERLI